MFMAGGSLKPGQTVGKTDELCFNIEEDPIHLHDLQVMLLHCRDIRLADVAGRVVKSCLYKYLILEAK